MKTKKFLALILILVGLGFSNWAQAQCTFTVTNNTDCTFDVEVHYTGSSTGIVTVGPGVIGIPIPCNAITGFDVYDAGAGIGNAYTTPANPSDTVGGCDEAQVYLVVLTAATRNGVIN